MKKTSLLFLFSIYLSTLCAQELAVDYGQYIYNLVIAGNKNLIDEFVDLNQYGAYIDRLDELQADEKEELKKGATKSYPEVKRDYNEECKRILGLYTESKQAGTKFNFLTSTFTPSKNFPDIGMVVCYYEALLPGEEETVEDAFRFECIKTKSGWRVLDGFFDEPTMNWMIWTNLSPPNTKLFTATM